MLTYDESGRIATRHSGLAERLSEICGDDRDILEDWVRFKLQTGFDWLNLPVMASKTAG
jgi:hypothetical protein